PRQRRQGWDAYAGAGRCDPLESRFGTAGPEVPGPEARAGGRDRTGRFSAEHANTGHADTDADAQPVAIARGLLLRNDLAKRLRHEAGTSRRPSGGPLLV